MLPRFPFRWFPSFNIFVWRDQTFSGYEDTDRPQRYLSQERLRRAQIEASQNKSGKRESISTVWAFYGELP